MNNISAPTQCVLFLKKKKNQDYELNIVQYFIYNKNMLQKMNCSYEERQWITTSLSK